MANILYVSRLTMVLVVVVIMPNVVPGVEVLKQMFPGEETKSQIHKQARVLG
jgi:hypothetical protein